VCSKFLVYDIFSQSQEQKDIDSVRHMREMDVDKIMTDREEYKKTCHVYLIHIETREEDFNKVKNRLMKKKSNLSILMVCNRNHSNYIRLLYFFIIT
jgi:hypothetical protein